MPVTYSKQLRSAVLKHLLEPKENGRSNLDNVLDKLSDDQGDKYLALVAKLISADKTTGKKGDDVIGDITDMIVASKKK